MYILNSELALGVQLVWFWAIGWDKLGGHGLHLGPSALAPGTKTKFIPMGLTQYGSNHGINVKEFLFEEDAVATLFELRAARYCS